MKKKILTLVLAVTAASMLAGCGKDAGGREENDYRQEEPSYEQSTPDTTVESEEPEEKPLLTSAYASAKPGNELQFGTYEQDNNLSNGAEPIDWVVLANEGDRILVLSKYVLEGEPEEIAEGDIRDTRIDADISYVTWEVCCERKWLNSIFYEKAFSDEERSCILQSEITTPDMEYLDTDPAYRAYVGSDKKATFHTYGGSDTEDYLFLLSYEEFAGYVESLGITKAEATAACISSLFFVNDEGYTAWLLRSPGRINSHSETTGYSYELAIVTDSGNVYDNKEYIYGGRVDDALTRGLRMAMWLKVE